jgi:hypothetical protein
MIRAAAGGKPGFIHIRAFMAPRAVVTREGG